MATLKKLFPGTGITLSDSGVTGDITIGTTGTFAPSVHATSHESGGADSIALDTLAVPTDITTLNASITKHGLCPKAPNDTTKVLLGDGTFGTLAYSSLSSPPSIPTVGTLTTSDSITGGGAMTGNLTILLTGDTLTPSNGSFYGYSSSARGWFTPATLAHATTHKSGGSDSIKLDEFAAPTDITTLNSTSSQHGLLVKVSGTATDFVGGDNACHAHTTVPLDTLGTPTDITTLNSTTSQHGLLPKLGGGSTNFLRADGTWATPAGGGGGNPYITTNSSFTVPALNVTVNVTVASAADMIVGQTHVITDGTLYMIGRVTVIATLVITYSNQGGGGSVSGSMGSGHVYMASALGAISGTATDFLGGDNTFHAHSTVALDTLGACTDITTRNATSSQHGLLVKVSGTATDFIGGDNASHAHSTVALDTLGACTDITTRNATSSQHGLLVKVSGTATDFVGGDNASHAHSTVALDTLGATTDITTLNASTSAHGLLLKLDNTVTHFLNGQGAWTAPANTQFLTTFSSFTVPALNVTVNVTVASASDMAVGETHVLTDGTLFMVGRITVIATLVITYSNQGGGGSVSGSMGAGHVYFGSSIGLISGTATDFLGGDNAFHAHSTVALDTLGACTDITTRNATSSLHGLLAKISGTATDFIGGDNASHAHSTVALDTLGACTDITTRNATSSLHGLLVKVSGTATDFVGGDNACHAHTTVALDTLGVTTDITTLNASATAHGLMPKADANAAHFYSSDGTQKVIPAATATVTGLVPTPPNNTTTFLRGDATFATPPSATATVAGYVPTPPNNTTTFLRGDATFAAVTYASLTGAPVSDPFTTTTSSFTIPAAGSPVTIAITSVTWPIVGQVLEINDGTHYGFFEVTTVTSGVSIAVTNRGYNGNPVSGTMATAASVSLSSPGQATSTQSGFVPTPSGTATDFFGGDAAFHAHSTVALDTLGACTDITTRNATSSLHGLLVKVSGTATDFVGGDNACHAHSTIPLDTLGAPTDITTRNATSSLHGLLVKVSGTATDFVGGDNACHAHSTVALDTLGATTDITTLNVSTSAHGLTPKLDNTVTHFLNGQGGWTTPAGGTPYITTAATFTVPAINTTVNVTVAAATDMVVGETHVITDGTLFMIGRITVIATLVITYSNQGGGGSVSGTMGAAHVYMASAQQAIDNTLTHFLSGGNTFITPPSATATVAGYVPTPPNNTTTFLRGDATFATPPSATATVAGYVPTPPNNTTTFLRGDATFTVLPANGTGSLGTVAASPNDVLKFYRGDSTWTNLPFVTETNGTFTVPAAGSTVAITIVSASWPVVGQTLWISDGTRQIFAEITVVTSATALTVSNRGYNGNSVSGTMATASTVSLVAPGLATSTQPGFVPAPPNNTTTFLRGDATFATPASATATVAGYVPTPPNNTTTFLRGDATFATPPSATATVAGYVPTPPNNTTTFLRGDATFNTPPSATSTVAGYVPTPPNNTYQFLNGQAAFVTPSLTYAQFRPYDNIPFSTTYPTFNVRGTLGMPVLDCADALTVDCLFASVMPLNANLGSGLTTLIRWSSHVATTGAVKWNVAFQRLNQGAGVATSFDTLGTVTTTTNGTIDTINISTVSALTTISSIAAGDMFVVKVSRDGTAGGDTMTDTAEIYGVEIRSAGT